MPRGNAATPSSVVQTFVDDNTLLRQHRDAAFAAGHKFIGQAYERMLREQTTGAILGEVNRITGVNGALRP